jgi:hypothetical protein
MGFQDGNRHHDISIQYIGADSGGVDGFTFRKIHVDETAGVHVQKRTVAFSADGCNTC